MLLQNVKTWFDIGIYLDSLIDDFLQSPLQKVEKFNSLNIDFNQNWELFDKFFNSKMERGNNLYNSLILDFKNEIIDNIEKLKSEIKTKKYNLIILNNQPTNLSLTFAIVIVSEELNIPVISKYKRVFNSSDKRFNLNSHLGEFYSLIEIILTYNSKKWFHLVKNSNDKLKLIQNNGINPASIFVNKKISKIKRFIKFKSKNKNSKIAIEILENYFNFLKEREKKVAPFLNLKKYNYIAGYSPMRFLIYLKSLIDPSYFRIEEIHQKSFIYNFLLNQNIKHKNIFFNIVEQLFYHQKGEIETRIDFSFEYRHRNKINYPYRHFTVQEFTGVLNKIYKKLFNQKLIKNSFKQKDDFFKWKNLKIDNLEKLKDVLKSDKLILVDVVNISKTSKIYKKLKNIKFLKRKEESLNFDIRLMDKKSLKLLNLVKKLDGYLITFGENSALSTDILMLNRFHIGRVETPIFGKMMGLEIGDNFVQFVPKGVRFCLAYPTPIRTGLQFFKTLETENSNKYEISGKYSDNLPWAGVIATVKKPLNYHIVSAKKRQPLSNFLTSETKIAWNGGFILNDELVGKLGLGEEFISSPLGLIIENSEVLSLPLFNKPALLIDNNRKISIQKVNVKHGFEIYKNSKRFIFNSNGYNNFSPTQNENSFYDLMNEDIEIFSKNRILVQLAGNIIKKIYRNVEKVKLIPVGILLSFPENQKLEDWRVGDSIKIKLFQFENIVSGIEAGPLLLKDGKNSIDMEVEGWNKIFSIKTQAGRLDYLDMRGPKIAVGINNKNQLIIIVINARIRESVGATHIEMMNIMKKFNVIDAMGFDPGGSATLIVNGKVLNISPYNPNYEESPLSLPPQPRAVSNGVIGY